MIRRGAVCVMPTDTVYGIVCSASLAQSVDRLYELKHRENKPGTIIAADTEQLVALGIPRRSLAGVKHFWPNPLSVVVPDGTNLGYIDGGLGSLAVRVPRHEQLRALLIQIGPLLTSSANTAGHPPAESMGEAIAYFGESVEVYVDGGNISGVPPSTLIRVVDDAIEVLRQGTYKIEGY